MVLEHLEHLAIVPALWSGWSGSSQESEPGQALKTLADKGVSGGIGGIGKMVPLKCTRASAGGAQIEMGLNFHQGQISHFDDAPCGVCVHGLLRQWLVGAIRVPVRILSGYSLV